MSDINKKVRKCGAHGYIGPASKKKKFKSGLYINTIKGVIDHPILHIPAYIFIEDDSYVECRRCSIIDDSESN